MRETRKDARSFAATARVVFVMLAVVVILRAEAGAQRQGKEAGDVPAGDTKLAEESLPREVARELSRLREAPGDPAAALAYRSAKRRGPRGEVVDLAAAYEAAEKAIELMPRYSTRLGKSLSTLEGADPDLAKGVLDTWEELGPGNIGGRTRALLIDPGNPQVMFAAGVGGGVWKSVDGGSNWRPLDDAMASLAVVSLAMDPVDSRVLYAGTGEGVIAPGFGGVSSTGFSFSGGGIFKSEDGGEHWRRLQRTRRDDFSFVNDLAVSSSDPRVVYAATRTGVWRSVNGGQTWRLQQPAISGFRGCVDLALSSTSEADTLFAACGVGASGSWNAQVRNTSTDRPAEHPSVDQSLDRISGRVWFQR